MTLSDLDNDRCSFKEVIGLKLGNVGDPVTLIWLFCDLHPHQKTLIRRGWRAGLPADKPPIWVFCPLLKGAFPRDRGLVERCEGCTHYKGVSHSLKRAEVLGEANSKPVLMESIRRVPKKVFTREDLEKAKLENTMEDEKWLDEERKLRKT
jgi:hypothetical protein